MLVKLLICAGAIVFGSFGNLTEPDVEPPAGEHYIYNGSYDAGDQIYFYGCILMQGTPSTYDGLLLIVEKTTGTVIKTIRYETGYQETFHFMGVFEDGTFFLLGERYDLEEPSMMFRTRDIIVLKMDPDGEIRQTKSIERDLLAFHNFGYCVILEEIDPEAPDLILDSTLEECPWPNPDGSEVVGTFDYQYIGSAIINGEDTENIHLTEPGNYDIEISDGTYSMAFSVTVHPVIENIWSGCRTKDPLRIYASGSDLTLNGVPFVSGEWVVQPGRYVLMIRGVNEYSMSIDFRIDPSVSGIEDGSTYPNGVTLALNGIATLDGKRLETGTHTVSESGVHELILWFEDERIQTLRFTIAEGDSPNSTTTEGTTGTTTNGSTEEETGEDIPFPILDVVLGVVALIGLFLVLKKR